jgi:hypothetical protein
MKNTETDAKAYAEETRKMSLGKTLKQMESGDEAGMGLVAYIMR